MSLHGLDPGTPSQAPDIWEKVLRKVASGEMPPDGMPAPTPDARASFVERLENALDADAAEDPNPGRAPIRRLNRAEYSNAVRDLLHLDLDVRSMLPGDDTGYGFDNIADVLSLSPALLDRYMFAARRVSRLAIGTAPPKPQKDIYVRNRETGFREAGHAPASRRDLPLGSGRGAALRYYFPQTGRYRIEAALDQGDSRTAYEHTESRAMVEAGMRVLTFGFPGESARPERERPDSSASAKEPHPPLDVRIDGRRLQFLELPDASKPYSRNPTCASCHVRTDPIGFALENYDAIGRWREYEGETRINASGALPGGVSFDGPGELKRVLKSEFRSAFVQTVTEKLLIYALGRGLEYYDRPTVRRIAREAERTELRFAELILAVTQSMPFQMRSPQP